MEQMEKIIVTLWITFGIYMMVFFAVLADLWSGVRKARKNGIASSSYGFKRTIDKMARYYNVMLTLTFVDAMQMSSLWYLECYYSYAWPIFPFITMIGAIGVCMVEVKSIYEKAEDKVRLENVAHMAGKIITNRDDLSEIVKTVAEYLKSNEKDEVLHHSGTDRKRDGETVKDK